MSDTDLFPRVSAVRLGYSRDDVDEFFGAARSAYEKPAAADTIDPFDVRRVSFGLKHGGYSTAAVDSSLDRLEIAFAARARERYTAEHGEEAWMANLADRAQTLYPRLRRPVGERFARPAGVRRGYSTQDVDAILDRLTAFFDEGKPLTADEVRAATFRRVAPWRAYDERVVDAYLARVIDILLGAS